MAFQGKGWASKSGADADFLPVFDDEREYPDAQEGGPLIQEKLLDADFFNGFEDDFDESDVLGTAPAAPNSH